MRLLIIGPVPPPLGGATVLLEYLISELTAIPGVSVLVINTSRIGGTGTFANIVRAIEVLARMVIKAPQVDVISFHASIRGMMFFGPFVWLISKSFGKPLVFRGFGGFFSEWHRNVASWARIVFNRTILQADTVLFETQATIDYFRSVSTNRIVWFPNARPPVLTEAASHGVAGEAKRFIFVGHVIPGKGIPQIIEAGEKLPADITIDVYGPLMEGMTQESFIGTLARYRGVLNPAQVALTIRQYDVLLLPTYLETEGHPGVILEAYSVGVPVIASRIGAIPEIVNASSGILIEPHSVEQLVEAMRTLMSSSQHMDVLRKGAAIRAQEFSARVWAAKYLGICRELATGAIHRI